jgi:hypothetical protein
MLHAHTLTPATHFEPRLIDLFSFFFCGISVRKHDTGSTIRRVEIKSK